jgi:hypothetical protein
MVGGAAIGNDRPNARPFEHPQDGLASLGGQMVREEAAVPYNHPQSDRAIEWRVFGD